MHSSRMLTVRCSGRRGGWVLPGGVSAQGVSDRGVSDQGEVSARGVVCVSDRGLSAPVHAGIHTPHLPPCGQNS